MSSIILAAKEEATAWAASPERFVPAAVMIFLIGLVSQQITSPTHRHDS